MEAPSLIRRSDVSLATSGDPTGSQDCRSMKNIKGTPRSRGSRELPIKCEAVLSATFGKATGHGHLDNAAQNTIYMRLCIH
jgi:hypothetical protein